MIKLLANKLNQMVDVRTSKIFTIKFSGYLSANFKADDRITENTKLLLYPTFIPRQTKRHSER